MSGSETLAANDSRQIFHLDSGAISVRDVIDAAFFRGEGQTAWAAMQHLLACERLASEKELETDDDVLDSAAQAYRYQYDLITAEETEGWLADRGLTLGDFSDYFARHYWADTIGEEPETDGSTYVSAPVDVRELFIAELMLSGDFRGMANQLSWRLAQSAEAKTEPTPESLEVQREAMLTRLGIGEQELPAWLSGLNRDNAWCAEMLRLEAVYVEQREGLLTPQARQRELSSLRLQLTVFELEIIEFDSHDAAREALLCVRDDGMSMEEVATEGRYPYRREQTLLEDIAPEVQQLFLSVSPGDLLDPMEVGGAFRLCRVMGKSGPDPEAPSVRKRIEQRLADRYFSDLVGKHLHWDLVLN